MLKFYYNPKYKYTNRTIIDVSNDSNYVSIDYENIDSPDTINGHIIYTLTTGESIPTYVVDDDTNKRWFVTGITQLRTGKFQISLLRDIVSESPNTWKTEKAFIAAGTATNYNKYKRWGLPFTNTKIKEERLNINGQSSFFVFYVNEQDMEHTPLTESDLKVSGSNTTLAADITVNDISELTGYQYLNAGDIYIVNSRAMSVCVEFIEGKYIVEYDSGLANPPTVSSVSGSWWSAVNLKYTSINSFNNNTNNCKYDMNTALDNLNALYLSSLSLTTTTQSTINTLDSYLDKVIYDSTNQKYYTVTKTKNGIQKPFGGNMTKNYIDTNLIPTLSNNVNWPHDVASNPDQYNYSYPLDGQNIVWTQEYSYVLAEVPGSLTFDFTFSATPRKLPRSAVRCINILSGAFDGSNILIDDNAVSQCLMLAQRNGINPDNTLGRILDVQYLPFSVATTNDVNSNIKINNTSMYAKFLDVEDYNYDIDLTDLTNINKETDTIKIVSPSRASQYLYRPYDNDGNMEFNVKITLKPYASTIYIRPSTKGLLMYDWDDKDCLIIQEDFSLTNVTSEWTNYIYNNKNYSNIFEREMQGRVYERSWERRVEEAQKASDEWTARNISAQKMKTSLLNLPVLSDIGAAIGTSWADKDYMKAAQVDREYNEAMYQESMSLARDTFNYQLDNIKSQPGIPSKITTIDIKFLDGVYLEYYSTNDTELAAIASYYIYNGNRIDDYGTFGTYWGNFVRGKIILSNNYTQPEINELNRRLELGIFTTEVS